MSDGRWNWQHPALDGLWDAIVDHLAEHDIHSDGASCSLERDAEGDRTVVHMEIDLPPDPPPQP